MSVHEIAQSNPSIGEAGATGDWRNDYPVIVAGTCVAVKQGKITCQICWAHCPDACISQGMLPVIDLTYCKGCGICAEVCPHHAIGMRAEAEHGVCTTDEGGAL
ncbi:MAG: pyruvate ferredoxin oxidoreductase [Actinobacteria bacterium]|nr:MAG: pyruvate ferredoxin oxidoreductase [Actinomycetota bacterium]